MECECLYCGHTWIPWSWSADVMKCPICKESKMIKEKNKEKKVSQYD